MLPQIKRPQRSDDGEVEIEVVDVRNVDGSEISDDDPTMLAQNTLYPKGGNSASSRPPASAAAKANMSLGNLTNKRPSKRAEAFGDEPTRLMPSKHGAKSSVLPAPPISVPPPASTRAHSSRPPAASASQSVRPGALPPPSSPPPPFDARHGVQAPLPNSSLVKGTSAEFRPPAVPSSRRPAPPPAFRDREESHTMLRPLGALSENAQHEPKASIAVPSAGAIKAQVDAARAKRLADQKARAAETLEVTPVSISERFVVQGRPAAPWAIAFVAMGIFAGLATAVFTSGRSSAIAAFIDPARLAIAAAAAQPAAPPATPATPAVADPAANMATTTTPAAPAAVDPALDLAPTTPTSVFAVGRATAKAPDTTPAATPVAHAAPKVDTPKPTPVAKADPPAAKPDPAPVAKADPKPAPAADKSSDSSSHASKSSKGKHGGGSDVDSAAAADALAKAQLENSL